MKWLIRYVVFGISSWFIVGFCINVENGKIVCVFWLDLVIGIVIEFVDVVGRSVYELYV